MTTPMAGQRPSGEDETRQPAMDVLVRRWVVHVLKSHLPLLTIAVRQRAKMEGWLKFELAQKIEREGFGPVSVEAGYGEKPASSRSDLSFFAGGDHYDIELKTPNTNFRIPGVDPKHRPITKNISGIIEDARKLAFATDHGIVCFVLFPVPVGDERWTVYLNRIAADLMMNLKASSHCSRVVVPLCNELSCQVIVCAFTVPSPVMIPRSTGTIPTSLEERG
ncbi:MAG: hypothetical protein M3462_12470 [Chloroflexota bacterium]|nr:hypothetical protein [Chloroflexota bacterium]